MSKVKLKKPFPKKLRPASKKFQKILAEEKAKVQDQIDACELSGRITAEDLATRIG